MKPLSERLHEFMESADWRNEFSFSAYGESLLQEATELSRRVESASFVTLTWDDFNRGLSLDSEEIEASLEGKRVAIVPMPESK